MKSATTNNHLTMSDGMFEVARILATGLVRMRRRMSVEYSGFSETGLDSSANPSVHSLKPSARGEKHECQ